MGEQDTGNLNENPSEDEYIDITDPIGAVNMEDDSDTDTFTNILEPIGPEDIESNASRIDARIAQIDTDGAFAPAAAGMAPASADFMPKTRNPKKIALITVGIIVVVLAAAYVAGSVFFMSHFGFNTKVNGTDVSFKTSADVDNIVKDQVDGYSLAVVGRDGTNETLKGADFKLTYVEDGKVSSILDSQNPWAWPLRLFSHDDGHELHATVKYDSAALASAIAALPSMDPAKMVAPQNAYPEFNGSSYIAHPEVMGTTINTEAATAAIEDAVENTLESVNLDTSKCYVDPTVFSDSAELANTINLYNQYVAFSITYTFGDQPTETLDGNTAIGWYSINGDGSATLNEDSVRAWLSEFAGRHDTIGKTRNYIDARGNAITVSGGDYGWSIDEEEEFNAIVAAMESKTSETREPIYAGTAVSYTEPDYGNTYIDLSLTDQRVWFVQDGQIIFEANVVTGTPTPKRETSEGTWFLKEKMRNKTLVGEATASGEPSYQTPVSYWLRMTWTGMGFHDASWQSSFGGDRYLSNGSHGCINMSYDEVAQLYDLAYEGMPIICHY